jgi:ribosomal protein L11 methyltransferase
MKPAGRPVWKIEVMTTAAGQPVLSAAIEDNVDALMAFELTPGGPWRLEGLVMDAVDEPAIRANLAAAAAKHGLSAPEAKIERLPDVDWLSKNRREFPPLRAGRYFVYGSHYEGSVPPGRLGLELDAGIAFGSGEHATTRGCLLALDRLGRRRGRPRRVFDHGCGSGILGIAAAKTWPTRVRAADIDRDAVRVAAENALRNGIGGRRLRAAWSDGISRPMRRRRYDLVFANILARPLRRLSRPLARTVASGGTLVLSGLLASQGADIIAAYRFQRLTLSRRSVLDGWLTLVLRRPRRHSV